MAPGGGSEAVGKPCSHAAGTRSVAVNARGPFVRCATGPGPPARFATRGRSGSAGKPPAPPVPAPQGCTATTRWGAAGSGAAPAHPANPHGGRRPAGGATSHPSRPGTRSSQGWGWPLVALPRPPWLGRPSGRRSCGVLALPCSARLARGERRTADPPAPGLTPRLRAGGGAKGMAGFGVGKGGTPPGITHQPRAPLRRVPPCPRPAACLPLQSSSDQRLRHGATGAAGDPIWMDMVERSAVA